MWPYGIDGQGHSHRRNSCAKTRRPETASCFWGTAKPLVLLEPEDRVHGGMGGRQQDKGQVTKGLASTRLEKSLWVLS